MHAVSLNTNLAVFILLLLCSPSCYSFLEYTGLDRTLPVLFRYIPVIYRSCVIPSISRVTQCHSQYWSCDPVLEPFLLGIVPRPQAASLSCKAEALTSSQLNTLLLLAACRSSVDFYPGHPYMCGEGPLSPPCMYAALHCSGCVSDVLEPLKF